MNECELMYKWGISYELARKLVTIAPIVQLHTAKEMHIISGYRTCADQAALEAQGRPAADCNVSNHTTCPATAVDIRLGVSNQLLTKVQKVIFGRIATENGLRWGGGSKFVDNLPTDWNHLDLGPRKR